jgi:adenylate cyclase
MVDVSFCDPAPKRTLTIVGRPRTAKLIATTFQKRYGSHLAFECKMAVRKFYDVTYPIAHSDLRDRGSHQRLAKALALPARSWRHRASPGHGPCMTPVAVSFWYAIASSRGQNPAPKRRSEAPPRWVFSSRYGGGVDSDEREWMKLGLYDPGAPEAMDRLATLRYLASRGATNDELVIAVSASALPAVAGALVQRHLDRIATREAAERAGIPVALAQRIMRTAGLGEPGPELAECFADDIAMFRTFEAASAIFGVESVLQFLRVAGAALATIADAAMTNFGRDVVPRLDAEDASELVRTETAEMATLVLFNEVPPVLTNLFIHHAESAVRRSQSAGAIETSDLIVGFLDLVGSTVLAEGLSSGELGAVISDFEQYATQLVSAADGRVVKMIGDEVMLVAQDADAACAVALDLADWVERHALLGSLRGALAAGELVRGYGDYYGPVVNAAARATKVADPGSIVVTAAVRDRVSNDGLSFETIGDHRLRGIRTAVGLFRLERAENRPHRHGPAHADEPTPSPLTGGSSEGPTE